MAPPWAAAGAGNAWAGGLTTPRRWGQATAVSTAAKAPKTPQAVAACHPLATMPLAARPLTVMPMPGPTKISPASAGAPSAVRRARHQPAT